MEQKNLYSKDLIKQISIKQNLSIEDTKKAFKFLIACITNHLLNNFNINITGFLKLVKTVRMTKQTTHPQTHKTHTIPKRHVVTCRFSKKFIRTIQTGT
tara:strand:+ start:188 stop:484 length:297 start_codon:yes stop_codon:yes gene_type:complete